MLKMCDIVLNDSLLFRMKFFIYDLIKFNVERLNFISPKFPEYYFSNFYFTDDEIEYFLNFPTNSGLIYKELFDIFIKNKQNITEICTSHDIAPFIYKIFGINKNFANDPSFKKKYKAFKGI